MARSTYDILVAAGLADKQLERERLRGARQAAQTQAWTGALTGLGELGLRAWGDYDARQKDAAEKLRTDTVLAAGLEADRTRQALVQDRAYKLDVDKEAARAKEQERAYGLDIDKEAARSNIEGFKREDAIAAAAADRLARASVLPKAPTPEAVEQSRIEALKRAVDLEIAQIKLLSDKDAPARRQRELLTKVNIFAESAKATLDRMRDQIKKDGSLTLTGPEAGNMDQMTNDLAVDMTKLKDAESTASLPEVQISRNTLPETGWASLGTRNSVILDRIEMIRSSISERQVVAARELGLLPSVVPAAPGAKQAGTQPISAPAPVMVDEPVYDEVPPWMK